MNHFANMELNMLGEENEINLQSLVYSLYPPVALTTMMTKCFEKLFLVHIKKMFLKIPAGLDSHQYTFRANTPTEDAISTLQSVFTHIENKSKYIRMLFADFSLSTTLCNWI